VPRCPLNCCKHLRPKVHHCNADCSTILNFVIEAAQCTYVRTCTMILMQLMDHTWHSPHCMVHAPATADTTGSIERLPDLQLGSNKNTLSESSYENCFAQWQ
jgi:hypothetical protein